MSSFLRPTPAPSGAAWADAATLGRAGWLHHAGWPLGTIGAGVLRQWVYIPRLAQRENVLLFAPPGQGKSSRIIKPLLRSETLHPPEHRASLIVVDPVGELLHDLGPAFGRTHRVMVWSPTGRSSCGFDPLRYLPAPDDDDFGAACTMLAEVWMAATETPGGGGRSDPYWVQQPLNLLAGLIGVVGARDGTRASLLDVAAILRTSSAEEITGLLSSSPIEQIRLRGAIAADLMDNEKARSGVFSDLRARFILLGDPRVKRALQGPAFAAADLVTAPTALFLQIEVQDRPYHPFLSAFVAMLVDQLPRLSRDGRPLGREIRLIADEIGNMGRIYGLPEGLGTLRKYGVGQFLSVQSTPQLVAIYNEVGATTIIDNCVTEIALGGVSDGDGRRTSERVGRRRIYREVPSYGPGGLFGRTTHSFQHADDPLRRPDELRIMGYKAVITTAKIPPVLVDLHLDRERGTTWGSF